MIHMNLNEMVVFDVAVTGYQKYYEIIRRPTLLIVLKDFDPLVFRSG